MKILERDKVNGLAQPTPTWPKTEYRDTKQFDTLVERLRWGGHASIVGSVTGLGGVAPAPLGSSQPMKTMQSLCVTPRVIPLWMRCEACEAQVSVGHIKGLTLLPCRQYSTHGYQQGALMASTNILRERNLPSVPCALNVP
jgi:hypothetical protein